MKLDKNYISAAIRFLKVLNFKFESSKVSKLLEKLSSNGELIIYDLDNNEVGKMFHVNNCYCMNIGDLESKISVTAYRNFKEMSSYVFRYNIFKFYTRESIDGYYEIRKKANDFLVESNYKISKNHKKNLEYCFDNIKNKFNIIDYKTNEKLIYNNDGFEVLIKPHNLKIKYYNPDLVYYEVIDKKPYSDDNKAGGYIKNEDACFEDDILCILNSESKEYFKYISKMKEKSDNILPDFYENNINAVLYKDSDNIKRKLFLSKK